MKEIWKDIEGYEGLYQVSNYGNIKSLSRVVKNAYGIHRTEEKILKPQMKKKGYFQIQLSKDGKQKHYQVHRLVALAFVPNINNYPCINHKDENKSNNHVNNLEWCTHEYNTNYGTRNKRASEKLKENMKYRKLTKQQLENLSKGRKSRKVKCITTGKIFNSIKEAANITGANASNITQCCKGKCKSTGIDTITKEKLEWKYVD